MPSPPAPERTFQSVSLVIPVFNEEESLPQLEQEVTRALDTLEASGLQAEAIFVNDGSTDGSAALLDAMAQRGAPRVRCIFLSRNFGQTAALAAAFDNARGDVIIPLDADLQNDPRDIPRLLEKLDEGYDLVSGWRFRRQDAFYTRRLPSQIANRLIGWITGVAIHDYGCTLKAYRREVLGHLNLYGEMHRFLPALASWSGARVAELKVRHRPRRYGTSKYGIGRTVKVLLDLITVKFLLSYAARPMQIFGRWGMYCLAIGAFFLAITVYQKIFPPYLNINRNGWLFLSILSILSGIQLFSIGLIGEINIRTYYETQRKKIYVVRRMVGFGGGEGE